MVLFETCVLYYKLHVPYCQRYVSYIGFIMTIFADQLKKLRSESNYSMQQLAEMAGVSKSMISKIERGEVQPTLDIATRLAQALGKTLSAMLETMPETHWVKISRQAQSVWEDPVTHALRRVLSPPFPEGKLEWLEVMTPPETTLTFPALKKGTEKYILVLEGEILIEVGEQRFLLTAGDSGYFAAYYPHAFINQTLNKTVYYLIIKH